MVKLPNWIWKNILLGLKEDHLDHTIIPKLTKKQLIIYAIDGLVKTRIIEYDIYRNGTSETIFCKELFRENSIGCISQIMIEKINAYFD